MKLFVLILILGFSFSPALFAATPEQEAQVQKFLKCIEDDYRRKTSTPQNHKMTAQELEALYEKPMKALTRLSDSAQKNAKSFEKEIPAACKPILEDLARQVQSQKP